MSQFNDSESLRIRSSDTDETNISSDEEDSIPQKKGRGRAKEYEEIFRFPNNQGK